jgi:hypothetical protein
VAERLRFEVLGPVRAWRDGAEIDLGSPQQRAILAILLLQAGTPASPDQLISAIWGGAAPPAAVGVIRSYVSRLRRVLPAAAIESVGGGYVLRASRPAWTIADAMRRLGRPEPGSPVMPPECDAIERPYESVLARLSPPRARAFRLLAMADGPDISLAAAAAVLDLPIADTATLLESLVDIHLLEPGGLDRYYYQEPLRMFARGHAQTDDGPEASQAALTRLVRFYSAEEGRLPSGAQRARVRAPRRHLPLPPARLCPTRDPTRRFAVRPRRGRRGTPSGRGDRDRRSRRDGRAR